jgi:hypothetical protein
VEDGVSPWFPFDAYFTEYTSKVMLACPVVCLRCSFCEGYATEGRDEEELFDVTEEHARMC